ncbi:MAG: peptide deformylase [Candidatus Marinimicrobia bacterium]|nr:peptide deformylase [Candidatus Neomarinimicrobiota bacterium]|tara:strand:+ start:1054 stop:1554 length:501 start_codon:yes stop_codon:yes gene_type:complete
MSALPLVKYGQPILRKVLENVDDFDSIQNLVPDMFDTMYEEEGIGLSANQIGVDLNLMVIDISHTDEPHPPAAFVNGRIVERSGTSSMEEGCLSVPGVQVNVTRAESLRFAYQDLDGNSQEKDFDGLMARVIQHEMDHLTGRLIIDHASMVDKHRIRKQLKELSAG